MFSEHFCLERGFHSWHNMATAVLWHLRGTYKTKIQNPLINVVAMPICIVSCMRPQCNCYAELHCFSIRFQWAIRVITICWFLLFLKKFQWKIYVIAMLSLIVRMEVSAQITQALPVTAPADSKGISKSLWSFCDCLTDTMQWQSWWWFCRLWSRLGVGS